MIMIIFFTNFRENSMLEMSALLTMVPILVLFRHSCTSYQHKELPLKKSDDDDAFIASTTSIVISFALDFLCIVLPTLLVLTVLAEWVYALASLSILSLIFVTRKAKRSSSSLNFDDQSISFKTDISSYRVALMIITCLCILGIDFSIFPRRYGKSHTYGTGLMDLGVGSFVVANSLVSRQARNITSVNWKSAFQSSIPLLLLGFGRLVSTTLVGYRIHVNAFGVHWNFFFTLAALAFLTCIFNIPPTYSGFLGSLILIGYQTWLSNGLNVILLYKERGGDIISQNKEGIFSILGYWGLYLLGVQLGHYLFFGNNSLAILRSKKSTRTKVWILSLLFWLLTILLHCYVEEVSRRTVGCSALFNSVKFLEVFKQKKLISYEKDLFAVQFGLCNLGIGSESPAILADSDPAFVECTARKLLGIFMLSDCIPGSETTALEDALNKNLLVTFLLANVLTGLVNMLMDTRAASSAMALLILSLYAFTFSSVIGLVNFGGIRLKFW
ncbi:hypothetical protein ACFE04_014030 [Oxalis oulophora]